MIVVAIIGVLAAIAIPAYQGYIKKSKINTAKENFEAAKRYALSEINKAKTNDPTLTSDMVALLNKGNKKAPFDNTKSAYTTGTPDAGTGQVGIVTSNGDANIRAMVSGDSVTVTLSTKPSNVEDDSWCDDLGTTPMGKCSATYTKE